jgi:salicylate hydroxylase
MAIEDAAVLADCMAKLAGDPATAMRAYERQRRRRTRAAQYQSRANGRVYQYGGPVGFVRNLALAVLGGKRLLRRYDWIYAFMVGGRPDGKRRLAG